MKTIEEAHIGELREQVESLLKENDRLRKRLDAWPVRALKHALKARESERNKWKERYGSSADNRRGK